MERVNTDVNIIDAVDVSVAFSFFGRRLRVLEEISLSVMPGEFLSILGPSGCGKSTLLRVLAGLLPPDKGCVTWTAGLLENRASRMAMNFQKPVLLPWLSVAENALLPLRLQNSRSDLTSKMTKQRLEELLELTELSRFANSRPYELSGGMQMRVALIRSLITQPEVVLMDEPFSAIDEITRHDLGWELRQLLRESSAATVFVTHSIHEAAHLSDRILVMSPRPSRVVASFAVDGSITPQDKRSSRSREFLDLCDELRDVMAHG